MKVLIYEDNLMWSSRLVKSVQALGHTAVIVGKPVVEKDGDVAIVNLGSSTLGPEQIVPVLREHQIVTIGHAGHKEKDLHQLGSAMGCDVLATNSELTYKIEQLLDRAAQIKGTKAG